MISVSDAYKELAKSRIRPKVEPEIKISGTDSQGNEIELVWTAKNIKDLKYKRGIDPLGRTLPFMELTWTEIYTGDLNEEKYPNKYDNIARYMKVELSFYQDLSFFNTWKTIYNSGKTWKDISYMSWKKIKKDSLKEKITFPNLYLTAKPTYKNKTITWKAVDILSFLEEQQTGRFSISNANLNPLRILVLNSRAGFRNSIEMFKAIVDIDKSLKEFELTSSIQMDTDVILDDKVKNILVQYLQLYGLHLDFSKTAIKIDDMYNNKTINEEISLKTMVGFPTIEANPSVSAYAFKSYNIVKNTDKKYIPKNSEIVDDGDYGFLKIAYDGYGTASGDLLIGETLTYGLADYDAELEVTPITWIGQDNTIILSNDGETYSENLKCNPYDKNHDISKMRLRRMQTYFKKSKSLKFKTLSNLSIETGDIVRVETNIRNQNGVNEKKVGLVVQMELDYNGALKQSFILHTDERLEGLDDN